MRKPKILFWDIESTGLKADWDTMLCASYKWRGNKKVHCIKDVTFNGTDRPDDSEAVAKLIKVINKADIWVTHYGTKFDAPFVEARAALHGLEKMKQPQTDVKHIDTWRIAKYRMRFWSNRLDNIAKFFNVKARKTTIEPHTWQRARYGHKPSLKYIYRHCNADIEVLEAVFEVMLERGLLPKNINLANMMHDIVCPRCGGDLEKITRQGLRYTQTRRLQTYKAYPCGHWFQRPVKPGDVPFR